MKQTSFNLKKFLKTAFYDDGRGHWNTLSRAWANCYKQKSDGGKGPQEAWNGCLDEYQKTSAKDQWILNYGADKDDGKKPYFDAKTPFVQNKFKK